MLQQVYAWSWKLQAAHTSTGQRRGSAGGSAEDAAATATATAAANKNETYRTTHCDGETPR
jgi:hypothetical protein